MVIGWEGLEEAVRILEELSPDILNKIIVTKNKEGPMVNCTRLPEISLIAFYFTWILLATTLLSSFTRQFISLLFKSQQCYSLFLLNCYLLQLLNIRSC